MAVEHENSYVAGDYQRELLDNLPCGAALYRFTGDALHAVHLNKRYCELVGREIGDPSQVSATEPVHPDDRGAVLTELRAAIREGRDVDCVVRILYGDTKDAYRLFRVSGKVIGQAGGEYSLYATFSEISQSEMSMRELVPHILNAIMASSTDLSFAKDRGFRYICCTRAFAKMAGGQTERDVIGKTDYDLFPKPIADKFRSDDIRLIEGGLSLIDMVEPIPSEDGVPHYSSTSKYLLRDTLGNVIGLYGVGRDITEHRDAYTRLKLITDATPCGLISYEITPDSVRTVYFNDGIFAFSGYTREAYAAMSREDPFCLVLREDRPAIDAARDALLGGAPFVETEYRCRTKDGGCRCFTTRAVVTERSDDVIMVSAVHFDVTEARENDEKEKAYIESVKLRNQLIDDSSASIYVCDAASFELLYVNKNAAKMCGKTVEAAKGQLCYAYLKGADKPCEPCYMQFANDTDYTAREYASPVSGKHYMTRGKFIRYGGRRALVQYMTDETERINARISLQKLVDGIPGGIGIFHYYKDGQLEKIYMNEGYYQLLGTTREKRTAYRGFSFLNALHPDDRPVFMAELDAAVREGRIGDLEMRVLDGAGAYRWLSGRIKTDSADAEKWVFYLSLTDVDREKRMRLRTEASSRIMQMANRAGKLSAWLYDLKTRRVTFEHMAGSLLGLGKEIENVPDSMVENGSVHKEDVPAFLRMYEALRADRGNCDCTVRLRNEVSGNYEWQHISYSFVNDDYYGNHVAVGVSTDVDAQQKARLLYEHELKLRQEVMNDTVNYYQINLSNGNIEEYHSAYGEDLREGAWERIVAEDRAAAEATLSAPSLLAAYARGETRVSAIYRKNLPGLGLRWIKASGTIMQRPGSEDIVAFLYTRDIDAEKKDQLALDAIVVNEIQSVILINVKSGLARFVTTKHDLSAVETGRSFDYDVFMQGVIDARIHPDDRRSSMDFLLLEKLVAALAASPVAMLAFRSVDEDGTVHRKRSTATYLDGTREDIILSRRDITDLYKEEQQQKRALEEAVNEANKANSAKTEFLSRMSHDMRTPLNAVIGLVTLAKDEQNPPQTAEYLEGIDSSSHFLLGLINDILDLSKMERDKIELNEEPFPIAEFQRKINDIIQPLMDEKHIEFVFDMGCGAQNLLVDKLRFSQIFFNLLSNAAKYTPPGGRVEFTAAHIPDDMRGRRGMRFIVRDNGYGMSEEFMRVIFTPFTRESNAAGAQTQGSGLGLAIVKNLVDSMGGRISVISELGKGTTFTVDLYAYMLPEGAVIAQDAPDTDHARLQGLRILLAEDNEINTVVAKRLLEKKGCVIDNVTDGEQAVTRFCASAPGFYGAILMDVRMPVMNGIEATVKIRALERADAKTIPIIAMTADALVEDQNKTLRAGMNAHISKPIEANVLYDTIARQVGERL
ncbi:MAG: PAS domain-containing protein [Clostridia bacterium]|nr:PAS domain-containing protein [Clostridia bacterium]